MNDKTINFIEKAIKIHGDKYDYSKTEYIKYKTKLIIICNNHGEFLQTPSDHLSNRGCIKCGRLSVSNKKRSCTEEFIKKSIETHGNKYDYSKTEYVDVFNKVKIICKIHGEFFQLPSSHIKGSGCLKCGTLITLNKTKSNTEEFIKKSIEAHGNKYDYSKTEYIKSHTKVKIICKIHGEFLQKPYHHLNGRGCKKCGFLSVSNKKLKSKEDFIKKAIEVHKNKYDYSKVDYVYSKTKIKIICKDHGEFLQEPTSHLLGKGCSDCKKITLSSIKKYSKEEFIEKAIEIHDKKYDYSNVEYIDSKTKIKIICKDHGVFLQLPSSHIQGGGCPSCTNKTEGKLYKTLLLKYPNIVCQFKQDWCKNITFLPFDFCIPEYKIIIELDGVQHFKQVCNWKSPEESLKIDKYKEQKANENNYSVIRILQQDVYNDTYNWYQEICNTIEELVKNNKVANYYLCKNNEYKNYL